MTPHRPSSPLVARSHSPAITAVPPKSHPPDLIPSYPNSAPSEDSELLEDDPQLDSERAAMYGQGDSIDEDHHTTFSDRQPNISTPDRADVAGLAQLRSTIGAMSQDAKEQEAVRPALRVQYRNTRLRGFNRMTCGPTTVCHPTCMWDHCFQLILFCAILDNSLQAQPSSSSRRSLG